MKMQQICFFVNITTRGMILHIFVAACLWLSLAFRLSVTTPTDIACLKSIRDSLQDPYQYLNTTWNFNNKTEGFICRFTGVECWHPDENKVLNIRLSAMGLKGKFPRGVQNCTSITGIDLSNNELSGPIPDDISHIIPFATSLDLSSNKFSGNIPVNLANCSYLNVLKLAHNRLTGQIPPQLGFLYRLKTFDVANNLLNGSVPSFRNLTVSADNYANNTGLCGGPLPVCKYPSDGIHTGVIVGAGIGGTTFAAIVVGIMLFFFVIRASKMQKNKDDDPDGNKWAKSLKGIRATKVSAFEKSVSKMRLEDLMKATNAFNKNNIIGSGRTGTTYSALLEDGTPLMVKRLQDSQRSEKEFDSEMATLGKVNHPNLVPLLGYCVAKKERLLIYKFMPNGNLHDHLDCVEEGKKSIEWPLRLKIGIRSAKGLAWMHHNCNPRILHRNISSKCILLDTDFEPKISDFGLARLMNPVDTHLSTFVNGEFGDLGYVAPEYMRTLVATPKGDVYSFGIVLLELVTGQKPTNVSRAPDTYKGNLVEWVMQLSGDGQLHDTIDPPLLHCGFDNEIFQVLKVACSCVSPVPKERPTMFEVYQLLRAIGEQHHFMTNDEILMMPSSTGEADHFEELIVAHDVMEEV